VTDAGSLQPDAGAAIQRAAARAIDARRDALVRGPRAEDRSAARAGLASARARLALARAKLSNREVRAPTATAILLSRFHAGEFFSPGAGPLLIVGDLSRLQVRLEVDEIDALRVGPGADCALFSDDSVRVAAGAVVRVAPKMGRRGLSTESPTARADVRVREVFVALAGPNRLVPGQRVWGYAPRQPAACCPKEEGRIR
jgi:multidrug resistance efflux pump